jgi:hypothetical protein
MKKTLRYTPFYGTYEEVIVKEHIVRFSKSDDGNVSYIHLTTGEKFAATETMDTLEARYNSNE